MTEYSRGQHPNTLRARRHNALRGRAKNASNVCVEIMRSPTATALAKAEARSAYQCLKRAEAALEVRVDAES